MSQITLPKAFPGLGCFQCHSIISMELNARTQISEGCSLGFHNDGPHRLFTLEHHISTLHTCLNWFTCCPTMTHAPDRIIGQISLASRRLRRFRFCKQRSSRLVQPVYFLLEMPRYGSSAVDWFIHV
jgi:hypothetical protein